MKKLPIKELLANPANKSADISGARSEERNRTEQAREIALHNATTHQERSTIWNALTVAAQRYEDDAGELQKVANLLRKGESFPLFAEGEDGARAAERLVAQFTSQAKDARDLIERFE